MPDVIGRRARRRHRDGENRVRAELSLVRRSVELDQRSVDRDLIRCDQTVERRRDSLLDVLHGELHALAAVALRVAVAQLERLVLAGGRAARHGGAASRSARERDVGFDGGVAAAVENFPRANIDNC